MQDVVERVVNHMWQHYSEPISLNDMAQVAILSPFHFSRVFRDVTGVSPGRFLSTIRLFEAKRLLVTTSLSVTDIAFAVGYSSLGTFTRRFTQSVGISPARFRRAAEAEEPYFPMPAHEPDGATGSIRGTVHLPWTNRAVRVYLGIFDTRIARGTPTDCDILEAGGEYSLNAVPEGEWYVQAVGTTAHSQPEPWMGRCAYVGHAGPIKVLRGEGAVADLHLRPRRSADLPVLLMLPDVDSQGRLHADLLPAKSA